MSFLSLYRPKLSLVAVQPFIHLSIYLSIYCPTPNWTQPPPFHPVMQEPVPKKDCVLIYTTQLMEITYTASRRHHLHVLSYATPQPPHLISPDLPFPLSFLPNVFFFIFHLHIHISSPLKSSKNTFFTRTFLLILPMAFRSMRSTTLSTCGIL